MRPVPYDWNLCTARPRVVFSAQPTLLWRIYYWRCHHYYYDYDYCYYYFGSVCIYSWWILCLIVYYFAKMFDVSYQLNWKWPTIKIPWDGSLGRPGPTFSYIYIVIAHYKLMHTQKVHRHHKNIVVAISWLICVFGRI